MPPFATSRSPERLPARVVLAICAPLTRIGVRAVLDEAPDFAIVDEATTADELISACRRLQPDLVVLDDLLGLEGLEAQRALLQANPRTRLLVLCPRELPEVRREALAMGAAGIIYTDATALDLHRALRDLVIGVTPLTRTPTGRTRTGVPAMLGALSDRELEVLSLVVRGRTNRQIAQTLTVTQHTVKKHVEHILTKLGVDDRTAAAVRALELGLVVVSPQLTTRPRMVPGNQSRMGFLLPGSRSEASG